LHGLCPFVAARGFHHCLDNGSRWRVTRQARAARIARSRPRGRRSLARAAKCSTVTRVLRLGDLVGLRRGEVDREIRSRSWQRLLRTQPPDAMSHICPRSPTDNLAASGQVPRRSRHESIEHLIVLNLTHEPTIAAASTASEDNTLGLMRSRSSIAPRASIHAG
jgi:hypothetical protein